jgi:hypothetical protein
MIVIDHYYQKKLESKWRRKVETDNIFVFVLCELCLDEPTQKISIVSQSISLNKSVESR